MYSQTHLTITHNKLRNSLELVFVPVLNVDTYKYICDEYLSTKRIIPLRKNKHPSSCGTYGMGVDINRNYGYKWGFEDEGSSPDKCDEAYRGEYAFSEPETQACLLYTSPSPRDS